MMRLTANPKSIAVRQWLLLGLVCVLICSCHHPVKEKPPVLKPVDKATLLLMVNAVTKTLSKKGTTATDAAKALKLYASTYAFSINGKPKHSPDSSFLYIYIQPNNVVVYVIFDVPKALRREITFADLKSNFGGYTVGPLPKEVIKFNAMFFQIKGAPGITVDADSEKPPGEVNNSIEGITVMRLEGGNRQGN